MSVISNALDQTKLHKKKPSNASAMDGGRIETDGNDPDEDLEALDQLMANRKNGEAANNFKSGVSNT